MTETLKGEYLRDLSRGLKIDMPVNYFRRTIAIKNPRRLGVLMPIYYLPIG